MKQRMRYWLLCLAMSLLLCGCQSTNDKIQEQLNLGEKYLTELDYDNAIVAFNRVIEIDPKEISAYAGKSKAYAGKGSYTEAVQAWEDGLQIIAANNEELESTFHNIIADMSIRVAEYLHILIADEMGRNQYDEALEYMHKLLEYEPGQYQYFLELAERYMEEGRFEDALILLQELNVDDASIQEMLDIILYEQMREDLAVEANPILIELALHCSVGDRDAVFNTLQTEEFEKVAALAGFLERPYITDTEYGKIGVYQVNSELYGNYMIYYGGYQDDRRHGTGIWLGYHDGNNYFASVEWADDIPNGRAEVREWNTRLDDDVVYRIIEGNVENGLWNGDVIWNFEEAGTINENSASFDKGHWIVTDTDHDEEEGYHYSSGDISLNDSDLTELRGIVGFGDF